MNLIMIGGRGAACATLPAISTVSTLHVVGSNLDNLLLWRRNFILRKVDVACHLLEPGHQYDLAFSEEKGINFINLEDCAAILLHPGINLIVAGLGGNTGTRIVRELSRARTDADKVLRFMLTMPFHFEGETRGFRAKELTDDLGRRDIPFKVLHNQDLIRYIDAKFGIADAFRLQDMQIDQEIGSLMLKRTLV